MQFPAPPTLFDIKDVVALLVKHEGIHEGLFDPSIEFNIGIGNFGPAPTQVFPGAIIGVSKFGIQPAPIVGPHTVDAAKVNPAPTSRKKGKSSVEG